MSRLDRIVTNPAVCRGQPTVRGLRIPVTTVLELLAADMTFEEILEDYPDLERDDLLASLEFGALATRRGWTTPLGDA
ncbi:DUF433 domain-containing protein [Actinomycetospora atypica]|uniref:DUF433 domain-containing protein n=1 Tax=Actinomycetospora atypica TaxID=1290095 RepID=A0ABV9YIC2_9PSEU